MKLFIETVKAAVMVIATLLFFNSDPICGAQKQGAGTKRGSVRHSFNEGAPWERLIDGACVKPLHPNQPFQSN